MEDFYVRGKKYGINEFSNDYELLKIANSELFDALKEALEEETKRDFKKETQVIEKKIEKERIYSAMAGLGGSMCYIGSEINNPYLEKIGFSIALIFGIGMLRPKIGHGFEKIKNYFKGEETTLDLFM
ncbi:MAG: hypothetical protein J7L08_03865 [Candidatus Aenigmarchaeota archaeon]|nr:hypothetical protein [Candidatus Aenigmarchaeota archaeon]